MKVLTRRDFLRISGVTAAGLTLSELGFDLTPALVYAAELQKRTPDQRCQGNSDSMLFLLGRMRITGID